jgi:hypothetical protein
MLLAKLSGVAYNLLRGVRDFRSVMAPYTKAELLIKIAPVAPIAARSSEHLRLLVGRAVCGVITMLGVSEQIRVI